MKKDRGCAALEKVVGKAASTLASVVGTQTAVTNASSTADNTTASTSPAATTTAAPTADAAAAVDNAEQMVKRWRQGHCDPTHPVLGCELWNRTVLWYHAEKPLVKRMEGGGSGLESGIGAAKMVVLVLGLVVGVGLF